MKRFTIDHPFVKQPKEKPRRQKRRPPEEREQFRNFTPLPKQRRLFPWKKFLHSQFFRFLATALGTAACFALFIVLANTLGPMLPKVEVKESGIVFENDEPEETKDPTVDEYGFPAATPTPAEYAPFGAQYGYGGSDLIPETAAPARTQSNFSTPQPTPTPTTAPMSTPAFTAVRKGMTGAAVTQMQEALIKLGYLDGEADGNFGNGTLSAVKKFQSVNDLTVDGVAGAKTLNLLYSSSAKAASEAPATDFLILVNHEHKLDRTYIPSDLVRIASIIPSDLLKIKYAGTTANRTAIEALYTMLKAAKADGVTGFQISSAYRDYPDQQQLVENSVKTYMRNNPTWSRKTALSATYNTVAPAGTSEHQTGLAFDITVPGVTFAGTEQQKWLHAHCTEYGFIVRFTEKKQKKTGFLAEAWHFRYVGIEAAQIMKKNDWCLEEYYENMGL